ncbi:MAG TPA: gephyrin-like molybdotransferase Glp [Telmatospirillum sp.]|nr:gephyrin-like molybdotransferase Glp [Telmatospirillum sp.]
MPVLSEASSRPLTKPASLDGLPASDAEIGLDQALALLAKRCVPVVGLETVPLTEAHGRVLAKDIIATIDSPPFANAAMDGFAVRHSDLSSSDETTSLRIVARIAAGHPAHRTFGSGEAALIFTGAPLPCGLDTVVMQENCTLEDRQGQDFVLVPTGGVAGRHVRPAGEDFAAGTVVVRAGRRLLPHHVALAATVGRSTLPVYRRLRVAVFSTGDEIIEPGHPLPPGSVYTSNRFALMALARGLGCHVDDLGNLPDRFDATCRAFSDAAQRYDLLITSGGVSVGGEDHVRDAVRSLGALLPWKLSIRPGKPTALGQIGDASFIGLPGSPVAAQIAFMILARPAILRLSGAVGEPISPQRFRVTAAATFSKNHSGRQFVRSRLKAGPDGTPQAEPCGTPATSGGYSPDGEGLVDMTEDSRHIVPGEMVDFIPYQTMQW